MNNKIGGIVLLQPWLEGDAMRGRLIAACATGLLAGFMLSACPRAPRSGGALAGQSPGTQCAESAAIGADGDTTIQRSYSCVPQAHCNGSYLDEHEVAGDFCAATNKSICASPACPACSGRIGAVAAPDAPICAFKPDSACAHEGEGSCECSLKLGSAGLHCKCGC